MNQLLSTGILGGDNVEEILDGDVMRSLSLNELNSDENISARDEEDDDLSSSDGK